MTGGLRLACLISGGGRTMINLAERIEDGSLPASIELVIASRERIPGADHARARGFDTHTVLRRDFDSDAAMHDRIASLLRDKRVDLVCLCGYLRWFRVDPDFKGRVINIHPALLPEFGGEGMYGERVHAAVIDAQRDFSGCTVHFVDDCYDHGPTIRQRTCPVLVGDDAHTLGERVFEQECIAYPEAIRLIAAGRVSVQGGKTVIAPIAGQS